MPNVELSDRSVRTLGEIQKHLTRSNKISLDDAIEFLRWNYEQKKCLQVPTYREYGNVC